MCLHSININPIEIRFERENFLNGASTFEDRIVDTHPEQLDDEKRNYKLAFFRKLCGLHFRMMSNVLSGRCYHVTIITIFMNARNRIYKSYSLNINSLRKWQN